MKIVIPLIVQFKKNIEVNSQPTGNDDCVLL